MSLSFSVIYMYIMRVYLKNMFGIIIIMIIIIAFINPALQPHIDYIG